GFARAVPGDVDAAVLAYGQLTAADRARRDGAARLAVRPDRGGELGLTLLAADVKQVARLRLALEVDQMQDTPGIDDRLRLNAAAGRLDHVYTFVLGLRSRDAFPGDIRRFCLEGAAREQQRADHRDRPGD